MTLPKNWEPGKYVAIVPLPGLAPSSVGLKAQKNHRVSNSLLTASFSSYAVTVKKKLNCTVNVVYGTAHPGASRLLFRSWRPRMADDEPNEEGVEPLPTGETEEERDRIRRSNDIDQRMEREGIISRRNRGYDEAAEKE